MNNKFLIIILAVLALSVGLSQAEFNITREEPEPEPKSITNPYGGINEIGVIEIGGQGHNVVGVYKEDGSIECSYPVSEKSVNNEDYKSLGCDFNQEGRIFTEKGFTE